MKEAEALAEQGQRWASGLEGGTQRSAAARGSVISGEEGQEVPAPGEEMGHVRLGAVAGPGWYWE